MWDAHLARGHRHRHRRVGSIPEDGRDNVRAAGLGDPITLRHQDVTATMMADAYDCAWFPIFFVTEPVLDAAVSRLVRSLRPGGWLVPGRMASPRQAGWLRARTIQA